MSFITIGNKHLPMYHTTLSGIPPMELPTPDSEDGMEWWINRMEYDPDKTTARLAHLEKIGIKWASELFDVLCRECL